MGLFVVLAFVSGCSSSASILADAVVGSDGGRRDAMVSMDADTERDAAAEDAHANKDAEALDANKDAGATDARLDASADGGLDSGADAGVDSGADAGGDAGADAGGDAGGCHSNAECTLPMYDCYPPGTPAPCGVHVADQCTTSQECGMGMVCIRVTSPCNPHNACAPACATQSCQPGFVCGADGICAAIPCGNGYTCPPWADCTPGQGDDHGCTSHACMADTECSGGSCVDGTCYASPGTCYFCCPP